MDIKPISVLKSHEFVGSEPSVTKHFTSDRPINIFELTYCY